MSQQPQAGRHHNFSKLLETKGYEVFRVDNITNARTEIQHMLARANAGLTEESFGERR